MSEELRFNEIPDRVKGKGSGRRSGKLSLDEALRAREEFLSKQPQLRTFQAEIDRTLLNVIGVENRMAVLGMMMQAKVYQLKEALLFFKYEDKKIPGFQ